jgi:hypothetical protein
MEDFLVFPVPLEVHIRSMRHFTTHVRMEEAPANREIPVFTDTRQLTNLNRVLFRSEKS